jgi:ABC-2 type transport system permease protein
MNSVFRIAYARAKLEIRELLRQRDALLTTLGLPILFLVLFDEIFKGKLPPGIALANIYLGGLLVFAMINSALTSLAISIVADRETKSLKRIALSPMPITSYFIGKLIRIVAITVAQTAIMMAIALLFLGAKAPSATNWFQLTWAVLLGAICFGSIGIALSSIPRSIRAAAAVINLPVLLLQFLSGVFFPLFLLPKDLSHAALYLPFAPLVEALYQVFLPHSFYVKEFPVSLRLTTPEIVSRLVIWILIATFVAARTFSFGLERRRGFTRSAPVGAR